jgi:hypothetical protein
VSAVEQLPIFSLREQQCFKIGFLCHWKEDRARPAILRNHDGPLGWQLFHNFAELCLKLSKACNFHDQVRVRWVLSNYSSLVTPDSRLIQRVW